jgi:hypothetical protein
VPPATRVFKLSSYGIAAIRHKSHRAEGSTAIA